MSDAQGSLFGADAQPELPAGMRYQAEFLSRKEEGSLVAIIDRLPLAHMKYQQYTARRRVVSYGGQYDFSAQRLDEAEPLPAWLDALRERAGAWAGIAPEHFTQALVAEYAPGTPLGWHRDVPDFEDVIGVSLLNEAVLRFRPYPPERGTRADVLKLVAAPRSIYLLHGPSRWEWQHSVSPTKQLRYSITLRTASARIGKAARRG
ncbi:alpha-ketoglutarate-dependent dioxygenase AlkB [Ramlibacter ginsenosidimutans]|uniref:Alpha-ketoglutarate-dependent dioxygenase AlkB n=1 Tax=Ramlibacter ginsenosidimutans TaxID=502333 RepID=A0A934WK13_9BURK|nr:alpha-ketoglutarate-dependent dioxygenase AlkB [Ramlibacter ginsenosidimutans]MBK6005239.1 alpha-ketoglutarate-dependent dioxygenase AlkB [Ramlibacter ginsenosidimutans]